MAAAFQQMIQGEPGANETKRSAAGSSLPTNDSERAGGQRDKEGNCWQQGEPGANETKKATAGSR
eukprot:gene6038-2649_t